MKAKPLKAPFPYFGGKSKVASLVWDRLGDVDNFIEPFAGSLACLLRRPHVKGVETVNDLDGLLSNFWRAVRIDPEKTAEYADWPVSELDLHARHRWLKGKRVRITEQLRGDPEWFDPKAAGWWCWGLCCWIGGGWCVNPEWEGRFAFTTTSGGGKGVNSAAACGGESLQLPELSSGLGRGINAASESLQVPRLSSGDGIHAVATDEGRRPFIGGMDGQIGRGVNTKGEWLARPQLFVRNGVDTIPNEQGKRPRIGARKRGFTGVGVGYIGREDCERTARPQLADAFDIGRGVNSDKHFGTCEARRAWLINWFQALADRLRLVRVCCGDWRRVCDSDSVLTRLGTTGVFLDPPYGFEAKRNNKLYANESGTVAGDVREWCLKWGGSYGMRVVLAGYAGEGHEELEQHGWIVHHWETAGGYANQSGAKGENAKKERLWLSPHCKNCKTLFDDVAY